MKKIYVYPKLSKIDLNLFRIGGAGLGNILFTYARAMVFAKNNGYKLIWPTWPSLKIGTFLRREKDKRTYIDLFKNNSGYVAGIKKFFIRLFTKKVKENDYAKKEIKGSAIIEFTGFEDCFLPIIKDSDTVLADIINNLNNKNKKAVEFDFSNSICMHVRLGDFTRGTWQDVIDGKHCNSIPIEWYVNVVNEIRNIIKRDIKVYVFSDGTDEELSPLLTLNNVERLTFGTSIADILALSNSKLFVASGSSFSMWARYLGRMTTIMLKGQEKQKILFETEKGKEISILKDIPTEYYETIRSVLV